MTESLRTAARLAKQIEETFTARGAVYGPPEDNFANIAAFWGAWMLTRYGIHLRFDATDVGVMSALIKVVRLGETPSHEDSALDAATYLLLAHGCVPPKDGQPSEIAPVVMAG